MYSVKYKVWAMLSVALLLPTLANANERLLASPSAMAIGAEHPAQNAQSALSSPFSHDSGIAENDLAAYRGGSIVKSEAVTTGLLQNATATNVITGSNSIADGAFAHAYGLPIVIQNSGANVLIQNSTIVNVLFQ